MYVCCHCSKRQAPEEAVVLCGHDGLLYHVLEQHPLQHTGSLEKEAQPTSKEQLTARRTEKTQQAITETKEYPHCTCESLRSPASAPLTTLMDGSRYFVLG